MASPTLNSLTATVPIINSNGTPNKEFMIKWQQLVALASGSGGGITTPTEMSTALDLLGSTEGDILARGASLWEVVAPGAAGTVLTSGGAGAVPTWAQAGGGLYGAALSPLPTLANTGLATWLNQGSSTVADTPAGVCLKATHVGGADQWLARYKAAPATPYTITALIAGVNAASGADALALGWYDGSSKLQIIQLFGNSGGPDGLAVSSFSTPTTFNHTDFISSVGNYAKPVWLQIADDGTNVHFSIANDGVNFLEVFTVAKASGYLGATGYANIGLFANPKTSNNIDTLLSWAVT